MGADRMPAAEVDVSLDLVGRLLRDQPPDLADRTLSVLANGWDNLVCRLGDDLLVRLPRRAAAAALVANEQRWLPVLAPRLPLPVPVPVRVGQPALGYPWAWSVVAYRPGRVAADAPPDDLASTADVLGQFLAALHQPAPSDAPANPVRGVPLRSRDTAFRERVARLADDVDQRAVVSAWAAALDVAPWTGLPLWLHGDLHPANLLIDEGRLAAVIDFGDLTAGDPATDLAVAWMLLPVELHAVLRRAYVVGGGMADDDTWARGRGWALHLAVTFLAHSADNQMMAAIGRRTLAAVRP